MIRGEFTVKKRNGESVAIPNQFTRAGLLSLMKAAFWQQATTWKVGLCSNLPADVINLESLVEPGATNGYARQSLPLIQANWPNVSSLIGEITVESKLITFTATGAYDTEVNRLFITDDVSVIAISTPLPEGAIVIDEDYDTRYRLYFR